MTAADLALAGVEPDPGDELFVPAGTTAAFASDGVARVRNPGARTVVALDVAIYHEEPRPLPRAFTTDSGISFQLLASASADAAPAGKTAIALERIRLAADAALPGDLSHGLTLFYIEAGTQVVTPLVGRVFAARAAAPTPYSIPGALRPLATGTELGVTAGGVVFLPLGAEASVRNQARRPVEMLALTVRETA